MKTISEILAAAIALLVGACFVILGLASISGQLP
jgi:hypothetical protein